MKKILLFAMFVMMFTLTHATVLVSDSNVRLVASFDSTWVGVAGYDLNPTLLINNNTVTYDASIVNVGSGGSGYTMEIRVRIVSGGVYSVTSVPVTSTGSVSVAVPDNMPYNITFWAKSPQSYNPSGYKELRLTNVTISN